MKKYLAVILLCFGLAKNSKAQESGVGTFEFSILGSEFVDRTSFGLGFGASKYWHERMQIGFHLQSAFNRQRNTFGYEIGSPYYTSTALAMTNTAELLKLGNFSVEANANFGWLFINLQDEDLLDFNPVFGVFEPVSLANETFRFFQGGLTLNYVVSRKRDTNISIFARMLQNKAFGNVRFGGEEANSSLQFNLGVKVMLF